MAQTQFNHTKLATSLALILGASTITPAFLSLESKVNNAIQA